jgi:hypothetical protein
VEASVALTIEEIMTARRVEDLADDEKLFVDHDTDLSRKVQELKVRLRFILALNFGLYEAHLAVLSLPE